MPPFRHVINTMPFKVTFRKIYFDSGIPSEMQCPYSNECPGCGANTNCWLFDPSSMELCSSSSANMGQEHWDAWRDFNTRKSKFRTCICNNGVQYAYDVYETILLLYK